MVEDVKKHLDGNFASLLMALFDRPATATAKNIHKAINGIGTDEAVCLVNVYAFGDCLRVGV